MKWQVVIVLLSIALTIAAPPSISLTCGHAGHTIISTLDICHSTTPALSSSGNMLCIQEHNYHPFFLFLQETSKIEDPLFKPVIITFQDEHPPKA